MRMNIFNSALPFTFAVALLATARASNVTVTRTPDGGIQPQVAVDSAGAAPFVFFYSGAGGGGYFFSRRKTDEQKILETVERDKPSGRPRATRRRRGPPIAAPRKK